MNLIEMSILWYLICYLLTQSDIGKTYNSFWNSCESTVVTDSVGLILVHLESGLEILKIWAMVSLGIEVPVLPLSNHTTNKPSWLYQCHIFAYNIFTCELGQDDFYIWDALIHMRRFGTICTI